METKSKLKKSVASVNKSRTREPRKRYIRIVECYVCGDIANDHVHYGGVACYSCRAFFRRSVSSHQHYECTRSADCSITKETRKHCQFCRYKKCIDIGMKPDWVMTEEEKKEKRQDVLKKKMELRKRRTPSFMDNKIKSEPKDFDEMSPTPRQSLQHQIKQEERYSTPRGIERPNHQVSSSANQMSQGMSTLSAASKSTNKDFHEIWNPFYNRSNEGLKLTPNEYTYLRELVKHEHDSRQQVPLREETLQNFLDSAKSQSSIPYESCVDGYSTCVQRIAKFMRTLDFFETLNFQDQDALLRNNSHIVVNLKTARLLKPNNDFNGQLSLANGLNSGDTKPEPNMNQSQNNFRLFDRNRLNYWQIFQSPWCCSAEKEELYQEMMNQLTGLEMDDIIYILLLIMAMLSPPKDMELVSKGEIDSRRSYFSHLLYKYVFATNEEEMTKERFAKYVSVLGRLREMGEILMKERLLL